jgi:hypothetical protein
MLTDVGTNVVYVSTTVMNVDFDDDQAKVVYSTTTEVYYVGT